MGSCWIRKQKYHLKGAIKLHYSHIPTFYILSLVAMLVFIAGVVNLISMLRLGKAPTHKSRFNLAQLVRTIVVRILLQGQLYRQSRSRWLMHVSIYWGFIALFLQTVLLSSLQYLIPAGSPIAVFFLQDWGLQLLDIWGDFWGLVMLFGLVIALIRRYVVISEQLHTLAEDAVVLWLLLGVVLTGFLAEGVRISLEGQAIGTDYSFIGIMVAKLNSSLLGIENKMVMFWVHGVISLALIAYLPFSKLVHVFTAPGEIILSSREEGSEKESLTGGRGEYLDGVSQTAGLE